MPRIKDVKSKNEIADEDKTEVVSIKGRSEFKRFHLVRDVDKTGMSGTGIVAEGVQFSDGTCILKWISTTSAIGIYHSTVEMLHIHSHGGKDPTKICYLDNTI